ncbi:hypothetical protein Q7P37_000255 [Cladosporium fusiforme]
MSSEKPEMPRGGTSKRTLIESACAACQKRKSRCDGQRPACTRCKTLHTNCEYNAEEGESRWSALRRKNRILERERDEARELVSAIRSRPELEAQELHRRIRADTHGDDIGALIYEVRVAMNADASSRQQQDQHQVSFSQAGSNAPAPQLPPLRSVINIPPAGGGVIQQPLPQPSPPSRPAHIQGSFASAVSSASYSRVSSSDGHGQQISSPSEGPPSEWPQRFS